jgi:transcriptional regulator with XRE-family HTH domain
MAEPTEDLHPLTAWLERRRASSRPMSRRELARRVGVYESALRAIEAGGGATLETGLALQRVTHLPLSSFLPRRPRAAA